METILFSASWCQPCKNLKQYAADNNIKFSEVLDIDTDEGADKARKFGVRSVPTTVVLDGDKEVDRIIGADTEKLSKVRVA